jgi:hypothetical protein
MRCLRVSVPEAVLSLFYDSLAISGISRFSVDKCCWRLLLLVVPGAQRRKKQPGGDERQGMSRTRKLKHFALLARDNPARLREISAMGANKARENGHTHGFTPEEARAAGRKGGTKLSQNREHMAAIGRLGGLRKRKRRVDYGSH